MAITFNPKDAISFIAKTIVTVYAISNGVSPEQAEIAGGMASGVVKGISIRSKEKSLSQKLSDTIKQAINDVIIDNPPESFYVVPMDCEEFLLQAFSFENAMNYLASSDPLNEITKAIEMACSKSNHCDLETLPIDKIASKLLKRINDAIFDNHELTSLVNAANTIELNKKVDVLLQDIKEIQGLSLPMDKDIKESDARSALCKKLYDSLKDVRDHHPSFRLMGEDGIDKLIFPHTDELIPSLGDVDGNIAPIWNHIKAEQKEGFRHIIIEGDGGMGKSVSLLSVTEDNELLTEIPAIYIHMYDLVYGGNCLTLPEYLAHNADYNGINELCSEGGKPKLMLLLDGLNEVAYVHQNEILRSIKKWASGHQGVQLIIASRPIPSRPLEEILEDDLEDDLKHGTLHIKLTGIGIERAKERLKSWGIPLPEDAAPIWETLKLPLFLTLYAKTANLPNKAPINKCPLDVREPVGQASLIWNYLQRELLRKEDPNWPIRCAITCEYIAPYIAYKMAMANTFELCHDEAEKLVEEAVEAIDMKRLPTHLKNVNRIRQHHRNSLPEEDWETFVLEESGIFVSSKSKKEHEDENQDDNSAIESDEDEYSFMHQNFRDCLAGLYLVNQAEMAEIDEFPEIWGYSQSPLALKYAAELMDAETANRLWEANRKDQQYGMPGYEKNHTATCTLLELHKRRNPLPEALDFSGMDLQSLSLTRYLGEARMNQKLFREACLLQGTKLDNHTFQSDGHTQGIYCLVVLMDGHVISGSNDHTLRVWDTITGRCLQTLKGHTDNISCVAVLPDSRMISGSNDHTLRIWDIITGKCLQTLEGHTDNISCVAVLPDSRMISGSNDHTLRIWDTITGRCLQTLEGHTDHISCVAALPNGRVISSSNDHTLRIWDSVAGRCLQTLEGHTDHISCVAVLPEGRVISGSNDYTLRIWDIITGRCLQTLEGHTDSISCVTVLPEGRVISGSNDHTLRIWDSVAGRCLQTLEGHTDHISCIAALKNRCVVSGSNDNNLRVWDTATGGCLQILEGHRDWIRCMSVLPDGLVVSGSDDRSLRVWDAVTGRCLQILEGHTGHIYRVTVLSDGQVISGSRDGTIRVWDTDTEQCIYALVGHTGSINCFAVLSGGWMVSGSEDCTVRIWGTATGQCLQTMEGHTGSINCVAVLSDRWVVSGSDDRSLRLWDTATGQCLRTFEEHIERINCVAVLTGRRVVSGSDDCTLRVWDAVTGRCLQTLEGHTGSINCVAVLSNEWVVSGSDDRTLRVWDTTTGQCLQTYKEHTERINCVAALPDMRVISGSDDRTLRVWDAVTGRCLQMLKGHNNWADSVALIPNGHVVSGSSDGTLRVWDVVSGQCLHILDGHGDSIRCITVCSNGLVISCSYDSTIRVWNPDTEECLHSLEATEVNVFQMDFSRAILTEDIGKILHQNGAIIPTTDMKDESSPSYDCS